MIGLLDRWCWLAIIISGRSHTVSIINGVDRESEKNNKDRFKLLSQDWFIRGKHVMLIIRLYIVELIQIILFFENHVRGISIIVGIMVFNIGVS